MSHVATIDVEVKDLDALAEAAARIGMELVRGQSTYRCWYTASDPAYRDQYLREQDRLRMTSCPAAFPVPRLAGASTLFA